MVDELQVEGIVEAAPGVVVVVALEDVLAGVVQVAVAEQEALATELQIGLVIFGDGVGDDTQADLVVGARPGAAGVVAAELEGLVDLGVGVGLVLTLVPAEAAKGAEVRGQLLL